MISNCPVAGCDGLYEQTGDLHAGVPHYTNGTKHLYYRPEDKRWYIAIDFTPDNDVCFAWVVVTGVALPMGEHSWRCYVDKKWQVRSLTTADAEQTMAEAVQVPTKMMLCKPNGDEKHTRWFWVAAARPPALSTLCWGKRPHVAVKGPFELNAVEEAAGGLLRFVTNGEDALVRPSDDWTSALLCSGLPAPEP